MEHFAGKRGVKMAELRQKCGKNADYVSTGAMSTVAVDMPWIFYDSGICLFNINDWRFMWIGFLYNRLP
jgi:hypothetical protein